MSQVFLKFDDGVKEHPLRMKKIIDEIISEINAVRQEGYELYTVTTEQMIDCNNQINEVESEKEQAQREYYNQQANNQQGYGQQGYGSSNNGGGNYQYLGNMDSKTLDMMRECASDQFDSSEYDQKREKLEELKNRINQNKGVLDQIHGDIVKVDKTVNDLVEECKKTNEAYTRLMIKYEELDKKDSL